MNTKSETAFEQYLGSLNLNWTRVSVATLKQPDYKLAHGALTCIFEVKEFYEMTIQAPGGFSPCPPIKQKIRKSAAQFKHYKNDCCSLVLWSTNIYRSVLPPIVLSAAFGEQVWENRSPLGAEPSTYRFSGRAELRADCNTTFSAIVILSPYRLNHLWLEVWRKLAAKANVGEEIKASDQFDLLQQLSPEGTTSYSHDGTIRAVVLENPYAKIAFPPDLFTGPFDQRWHMESGLFKLSFIGSELQQMK